MRNIVLALLLLVAMCGLSGCVTTRAADGQTTTSVDQAATISILTVSIQAAQTALDTYLAHERELGRLADAAEVARRQAVIDALRDALTLVTSKSGRAEAAAP